MIKIEYARGPGGLPQNYPSRDISTTFNLVLETQQVDLIICTNAVILKHRALLKTPKENCYPETHKDTLVWRKISFSSCPFLIKPKS